MRRYEHPLPDWRGLTRGETIRITGRPAPRFLGKLCLTPFRGETSAHPKSIGENSRYFGGCRNVSSWGTKISEFLMMTDPDKLDIGVEFRCAASMLKSHRSRRFDPEKSGKLLHRANILGIPFCLERRKPVDEGDLSLDCRSVPKQPFATGPWSPPPRKAETLGISAPSA